MLTTLTREQWEAAGAQDAYLCSFEVSKAFTAAELAGGARATLGATAPALAAAFDAAALAGIRVLGVAPAHRRHGKWAHRIPGDPPRVYVGPERRPARPGTLLSPPPRSQETAA